VGAIFQESFDEGRVGSESFKGVYAKYSSASGVSRQRHFRGNFSVGGGFGPKDSWQQMFQEFHWWAASFVVVFSLNTIGLLGLVGREFFLQKFRCGGGGQRISLSTLGPVGAVGIELFKGVS